MPLSVRRAGGPHSVRALSKYPFLGNTTPFSSPFSSNSGVQLTRSSEVAILIIFSPQYIRYLPFTLVMTCLPLSSFVTIEPDLLFKLWNLPS